MSKFEKLVQAQGNGSLQFDFTNRKGSLVNLEISICEKREGAYDAMFRKDGKYIGSIERDAEGKYSIWGECSLLNKRWLQLIREEIDREDSCIAPAWKNAILSNLYYRIANAQAAYDEANRNLYYI